jgi:hypothetical protein
LFFVLSSDFFSWANTSSSLIYCYSMQQYFSVCTITSMFLIWIPMVLYKEITKEVSCHMRLNF